MILGIRPRITRLREDDNIAERSLSSTLEGRPSGCKSEQSVVCPPSSVGNHRVVCPNPGGTRDLWLIMTLALYGERSVVIALSIVPYHSVTKAGVDLSRA